MLRGWGGGFDLRKSSTISLVLVVFNRRLFFSLQSVKVFTRSLSSPSWPFLITKTKCRESYFSQKMCMFLLSWCQLGACSTILKPGQWAILVRGICIKPVCPGCRMGLSRDRVRRSAVVWKNLGKIRPACRSPMTHAGRQREVAVVFKTRDLCGSLVQKRTCPPDVVEHEYAGAGCCSDVVSEGQLVIQCHT